MAAMKSREDKKYNNISSAERDEMIRRLERERVKVNAEIDGILKSYSKESGNRALKRTRRKKSPNDWQE